jgi:hypothetical protein
LRVVKTGRLTSARPRAHISGFTCTLAGHGRWAHCAGAQRPVVSAVPRHPTVGGCVTGAWQPQEPCGQLPRYSSMVRLGRGSGHRNCSYRVSLSMNRLSQETLYFAIVVFDELGVKCVAEFSSR